MSRRTLALLAFVAFLVGGPAGAQEEMPRRKMVALPAFKVLTPAEGDEEVRKLLKERYTVVTNEMAMAVHRFRTGDGMKSNDVVEVGKRTLKAMVDVSETPAQKQDLLAPLLDTARGLEKSAIAGLGAPATLAQRSALARAVAFRLEVEIEVLRAKKAK